MKPDNLTFPQQERELIGAELIEAMMKFKDARSPRNEAIRLTAGTHPGVCPQNGSHPGAPGGDPSVEIAPRVCAPFFPRLVESRAAELDNLGLLDRTRNKLVELAAQPARGYRHGAQKKLEAIKAKPAGHCDGCHETCMVLHHTRSGLRCLPCIESDAELKLIPVEPLSHATEDLMKHIVGQLSGAPAKHFASVPAGGGPSTESASPVEPCLGTGATIVKAMEDHAQTCRRCGAVVEAGLAIVPCEPGYHYVDCAPITVVRKCPDCGHSFT